MAGNAVFLTGGTGFLGTVLADILAEQGDRKIYALVRAKNESAAARRLAALWDGRENLCRRVGSLIIPVPGDFEQKDLGLKPETAALLREEVGVVIHSGAEIGFQTEGVVLEKTNREGTANLLDFAQELPGLERFVHISTAYVSGQNTGHILEDAAVGSEFSSMYEKTKAEAEGLVRASGLPFVICRPGMIVGDSKTGWVKNFNTIYYVLKLLLTQKLPVLPITRDTRLNLVPVDYVAQATAAIAFAPGAEGKTFHLTCPTESQPTAGELVDYVTRWAEENLNTKLPTVRYLPMDLKALGTRHNKKTTGRKKNLASNLLTLLPYFYGQQDYDRANTDETAGEYTLDWRDYIDSLLTFACRKNFMRQTGQTVFEQAMVRRVSKRYPMRFYDVTAEGIKETSGRAVNLRVKKIAAALWARGVRAGDKVALTGINSVDYMTLDHAIGLLGAVTVPIYYTTPIAEAALLLERSGARWFFVGDRRIMRQISALTCPVQVVAFSDGLTEKAPGVMGWQEFLSAGTRAAPLRAPNPGDLATIRYTSGTTGEPKGVMFSFRQLAWMGEVLTNLLPWQDRNRTMRYLSFLPESHVVEGILASYAPYYMLAKVDFYFLNDFGALVESLPKVRPTVFFSVPRFYEKLWEQVVSNPVGQKYLSLPEGAARKALGLALKTIVLKKAGLDQCCQLIVGSAPISEALLRNFRALGIEIHNAYGQTEAPLITINRLGDNVIPTIGTPLPETEVTVQPDGELIVRGPQVALGYYGLDTDTIRDGVLKTGDLGEVGEDGHIRLHGRKKEMIITAYGKNISTPKIEEALKNIPCVTEAVLIGENRPYCTALLWTEGDTSDLDKQIEEMNRGLSHPEQIRAYRVIETPLSIQAGELTPNLKVKRAPVETHYKQQVEEMYL